jgi:CDP-diacylglycerol--serine O-phosphatidyltransferase
VAFLYAACAALRLARFNTQVGVVDKRYFIGLASPAAAGALMAFVWTATKFGYGGADLEYAALAVTVLAALLMVSRIRYHSGKALPFGERVPFVVMLGALGLFVALAVAPDRVLLAVFWLYALSGPVAWAFGRLRRRSV